MNKKILITLIFSFVFFTIYAGKKHYGTEVFKHSDFNFEMTHNKRTGFIVLDQGEQKGFVQTFKTLYGDNKGFIASVYDLAERNFDAYNQKIIPILLTKEQNDHLVQVAIEMKNDKSALKNSEVFQEIKKTNNLDYVFFIYSWHISNKRNFGIGVAINSSFVPIKMGGAVCHIALDGWIINSVGDMQYSCQVDSKGKVLALSYKSTFESALKLALSRYARLYIGLIQEKRMKKKKR